MPDDLLLVDIGNSRIKWVRAPAGRIDTETAGHGDLEAFARAVADCDGSPAAGLRLACVAAEDRAEAVESLCRAVGVAAVTRLQTRDGQGGLRCAYADPNKLGVDRWLALVGAAANHGKPVVAWDLGTAATLDAVDAAGRHLGGWILPGPGTMQRSLNADTRLPSPREAPDRGVREPGRDTSAAIRRGILAAQLGALDRFLDAIGQACGAQPTIVLTGGAAEAVRPHVARRGIVHDPWLVFRGMLVD